MLITKYVEIDITTDDAYLALVEAGGPIDRLSVLFKVASITQNSDVEQLSRLMPEARNNLIRLREELLRLQHCIADNT